MEAVTTSIVNHQPPIVPDRKETAPIITAGMTARLVGARAACRGDAGGVGQSVWMVGHVGMYGVGRPLVNLRSEAAGWDRVVLAGPTGATVGPVSYRGQAGYDRSRGSAGNKGRAAPAPEDPGPKERIPRSPPASTGARPTAHRGKRPSGRPSLWPCRGPFAIHPGGYKVVLSLSVAVKLSSIPAPTQFLSVS